MELAKQQHRQELYINAGVWFVVLLFLGLAALQGTPSSPAIAETSAHSSFAQ